MASAPASRSLPEPTLRREVRRTLVAVPLSGVRFTRPSASFIGEASA